MAETMTGAGGVRRLTELLAGALRLSLILAALVMLASITIQVVMRYVFSYAPPWSEELAILMFSWATIGGLALGVREGFHVRLTLLLDPLPKIPRDVAERAMSLITAGLGAFLAWSGWRFMDLTSGSVSAAIAYPIEILNVMAPVSGGLIFVFALEHSIWPRPATELEAV
jgi:TRAP-type C4-dicarboxylate transport system permease small subunit